MSDGKKDNPMRATRPMVELVISLGDNNYWSRAGTIVWQLLLSFAAVMIGYALILAAIN